MSETPRRQTRFPLQGCLIQLRFSQDEGSRVIRITGTERHFGVPQPPATRIRSLHLVKASQLLQLLRDWEGTSYLFLSTSLAAGNQKRKHDRVSALQSAGSQSGKMEARVVEAGRSRSGQSARSPHKTREETLHIQPMGRFRRARPILPH
ncbi:hypothetical protein AAFF_G00269050 [Aldrovandia affinis]|uniref:Uncharacterized protein n=1 Tax=Aldrovandia affinis TaxID=143900 RepID=A0AAD7WSJ6_9TELE|nr:hypothetical protein AAFF_G00269050 [Aldrovandia affinis]